MEVTQHESIIAPPMSQHVVQSSPKNTSIEGSLSEILETMANGKVIKTKNGPKKLARQPFMNAACKNFRDNPGEENIKIENEIPEIFNPGFASPENVSMAKRQKFCDYVIN